MRKMSLSARAGRQGMALVIVLSLIVVLTIILVSFVSQARFDASASSSFSQAVSVDNLAQDAVNATISTLLYEMEDGSTVGSTNGVAIYSPKTALDIPPKWDASVPTNAAFSTLPNLIRTSASGPLFAGSSKNSLASSIGTDQASTDGRRIGAERWNTPMFLPASNTAVIPKWIYVSRKGPVALTGSITQTLTQSLAGTDLNPDFIIGRFAYRIYDAGGLLDVNAAGYPAGGASAERIGRKGGLPFASLAGAVISGLTDGQEIAGWRWPLGSYADYVDGEGAYLGKGGSLAGFLTSPAGANRFLSRADLLQYLQSPTSGATAAVAAPELTIFSRELNAPVWEPDSTATAEAKAMNPSVLAARVAISFTRRDGTTAEVGEPLLNGRFPLSKIALFDDPAANVAEIRKYFGLEQNSDGTWIYVHGRLSDNKFNFAGDADGSRERLKTFAEIAAGTPGDPVLSADGAADASAREPNFFEMLQEGILMESMGQGMVSGDTASTTANYSLRSTWADRNIARHVLQIGANIIDQWDANDDPTVIARTPFDDLAGDQANPDPDISGVENLPYIYKVPWVFFRRFDREVDTGTDGNPVWPWFSSFYQFQLWNPHRNASVVPAAREMRIVAKGQPYIHIKGSDTKGTSINTAPYIVRQNPVWPLGQTWIGFTVNPSSGTADFASPHTLKADDPLVQVAADVAASQSRDEYVYAPAGTAAAIVGFHAGSMKLPYTSLVAPTPSIPAQSSHAERYNASGVEARAVIRQTVGDAVSFQLQKKDAAGHWLPVQTIPCIFKDTYNYRVTLMVTGYGEEAQKLHANRVFYRAAYMTADPRSFRFGFPQMGTDANVDITSDDLLAAKPMASNMFSGWLASNAGAASWLNEGLARNATTSSYYRDRGGAGPRLGDSAANGSSPYSSGPDRPVVLNRPFRSVAEMAYANRGLPWRNLNFTGDLATPAMASTADGALLDLFTIEESPAMRAGVINLNTASVSAIKALLLNADVLSGNETNLSDTEAGNAADAIFKYVHGTLDRRAIVDAQHVLRTPADIARMVQALSSTEFSGWSKRKKESVVAALAQAHNGRTWNLVLDLIAQTGRFPTGSSGTLDKFMVAGEKRVLVHLAIDRYTGQVIDRLTERISE